MAFEFDTIADELARDCDGEFGERLRIEPRSVSDFTSSDDPSRPAREIIGSILTALDDEVLLGASRQPGNAGLGRLVLRPLVAQLSRGELAKLGYRPRKGDIVIRLDRAIDRRFEVSTVNPLDFGEIVLTLVAVGDAS